MGRWNNIIPLDILNSKDCEKVIPNVVSSRGTDTRYAHRAYLVKSLEGDLWLVRKAIGFPDDNDDNEDSNISSSGAIGFEVYKLELDLQTGKLIQMLRLDSLGDNVFFLGDSDSVSMSASYFVNYL